MDLEEHSVEPVIQRRCAECGTSLTSQEIESSLESGGPFLCTVHAMEQVDLGDEEQQPG